MYISQQIAATAVQLVVSGRNLTLALPEAMKLHPKATLQQRGAAADLSYGTLRYLGEINAYLAQLLEKPLSSEIITHLLQVAIFQLLHDEAEDFTVVNQAVIAAGDTKPRWAKGLVNGVLRNFLRQKEVLADKLTHDEVAIYSYPKWWINICKQQFPEDWQDVLTAGNRHPPLTLRVNPRQTNAQSYMQLLARQDIQSSYLGGDAVMLSKPLPVEQVPGFKDGAVSVQDYGAQLAAHLITAKDGVRLLDACAAPGGKTGHLLEQMNLNLSALDSDRTRLNRVAENLTRLKLHAKLLLGDAANPTEWWDGIPYDLILADVPCSASGIVRRHVDIKWLRRESDITKFTKTQAEILNSLWQLLAKGGKLLYVTCSIFKQENQLQIDAFLSKNNDAIQLPLLLTEELKKNIEIRNGQLIPNEMHDGLFYALLQKN